MKISATDFKNQSRVKKIIDEKLKEIASQHKHFVDKEEKKNAENGDQVIFDYSATVDGNSFEGSEGKGVQNRIRERSFS